MIRVAKPAFVETRMNYRTPESSRHRKDIQRRRNQWDRRERVPHCKNHQDKLVKPSAWINRGLLLCTWCFNNQSAQRRALVRYRASSAGKEQHRWRMRSWRLALKIMENKF